MIICYLPPTYLRETRSSLHWQQDAIFFGGWKHQTPTRTPPDLSGCPRCSKKPSIINFPPGTSDKTGGRGWNKPSVSNNMGGHGKWTIKWMSRCISYWTFWGIFQQIAMWVYCRVRGWKTKGAYWTIRTIFSKCRTFKPPNQAFGSWYGKWPIEWLRVLCFGEIVPQDLMIQKDGFWSFIPSFLGCFPPKNGWKKNDKWFRIWFGADSFSDLSDLTPTHFWVDDDFPLCPEDRWDMWWKNRSP